MRLLLRALIFRRVHRGARGDLYAGVTTVAVGAAEPDRACGVHARAITMRVTALASGTLLGYILLVLQDQRLPVFGLIGVLLCGAIHHVSTRIRFRVGLP